jgi:L-arabinose isomerase
MRAAVGWHAAQHLRMVRFGDGMRGVAVTDGDRVSAQITFGISNDTYGVNDLVEVVDAATDAEVDAVVAAYADEYELAPELAAGGERHESLRYGARIEVGLLQFLEGGRYGAFTTNFEDLGGLRQLPGLAVQRLMSQGYGFGGEGDWKTSALLRIVKAMTAGLPGGTSFMEDYTYHFGPGEPRILGAHMLEVCPTITTARPRVEIHPLGIGNREDPVRLVFTADPGPGVVVSLTDLGPRFRMVANEIDLVEPDEPLPALPVARAVWTPRPSLATSAESWMYAGGSHHSVLTTAVGVDVLATFADLARTELLVIDAASTVRDVQRELRWNDLYYRLAAHG